MRRPTRRQVVKGGVTIGAAAAIGGPRLLTARAHAAVLDPTTIPKYVTPLFILPAMPAAKVLPGRDEFTVAARRFTQQILPSGFPRSIVYGFGSTTGSETFHTPGFTIEARVNRQTRVTWLNQLVDRSGDFIPHFQTIDPTLHWANPPGGISGRDSQPGFGRTPRPYTGPIPHTVHHHGERSFEESDGYPESWFLPNARNIPAGHARVGSFYDQFKAEARQRWGVVWPTGGATFVYPNDQPAATNWCHDHALGMTRNNVYSGLALYYLLRGGPFDLPPGVLPGPAPRPGDPPGTKYYEIPLVLRDESFNSDGSILFPSRNQDAPAGGPYVPNTDVPPYWASRFLGNTILVNGNTWPFLNVEPRRYRFRLLAAANFRPWILKVVADLNAPRPAPAALPIWVIGSDGGYLPRPQQVGALPMFTSERYDVIVDFTGLTPGTTLYLSNEGAPSDRGLTDQIMQFRVVPLTSADTSVPPSRLRLPGFPSIPAPANTRKIALRIDQSAIVPNVQARLVPGTVNADRTFHHLDWSDPITETVPFNTTETWEVHNFTAGGHIFHIHLVQFSIVDRLSLDRTTTTPPGLHETGPKDTMFVPGPGISRFKATFDRRSRYVWHCHFLEHEDHGMMRPWMVV